MTMTKKLSKTFTFNVPSVLSFDWLFEFHCDVTITDTQQAVVDIEEATIGSGQVTLKHNGPMWFTWLKVLAFCQGAAVEFVKKTNKEDDKDDVFTGK